jgi:hypothetical protein
MNEGYTDSFEGERVTVGRSAVRRLSATNVEMEQSAVQVLSADTVTASASAVGISRAATTELKESAAGVVIGDYVRVDQSRVFLLIAPRVNGNVRAVVTLPGVVAIVGGLVVARLAARVIGRRRR